MGISSETEARTPLQEISLGTTRSTEWEVESRLEQQFDYLLDLLAEEQATTLPDSTLRTRLTGILERSAEPKRTCDLSLLILADRVTPVESQIEEFTKALDRTGLRGEVVLVDLGGAAIEGIEQKLDLQLRCQGLSYRSAFERGLQSSAGEFVIVSSREQMVDATEISAMVEKLRQGADLVQGKRIRSRLAKMEPKGRIGLLQRLGRRIVSFTSRATFGTRARDVMCRAQAFRRSMLKGWSFLDSRSTLHTELLARATQRGFAVSESTVSDRTIASSRPSQLFSAGWSIAKSFIKLSSSWCFGLATFCALATSIGALGILLTQSRFGERAGDYQLFFIAIAGLIVATEMLACGLLVQSSIDPLCKKTTLRRRNRILGKFTAERVFLVSAVATTISVCIGISAFAFRNTPPGESWAFSTAMLLLGAGLVSGVFASQILGFNLVLRAIRAQQSTSK